MARKARGKKAKNAKRSNAGKKTKTKKNKAMSKVRGYTADELAYAKLVKNPCHGPLVRSMSTHLGTPSMVERVRRTLTNYTSHGYVVWFPSYHSSTTADGISDKNYSCFHFENSGADLDRLPTNTKEAPMGVSTSAAGTGGIFLADPISSSISNTSLFKRARTISACISIEYKGKLMDVEGVIAKVSNIAFSNFFAPRITAADATPSGPSVNGLLAYAGTRGRVNVEGEELRWRPTEESTLLRTAGGEASNTINNGISPDTLWIAGDSYPGDDEPDVTKDGSTDSPNATGIVLVYSGVPPGSLNINLVKVVELELSARAALIEEPHNTPPSTAFGKTIANATALLDSVTPGWQTAASEGVKSLMKSELAESVKAFAPRAMQGVMSSFV